MSLLVTERWSPQVVSYTAGSYTAAREFDVTGVANQTAAFSAVGAFFPDTVLNAQHPQNTYLYSMGPSAGRPGFGVFAVRVQYQSTPMGRFEDPGNPLAEPVIYRWSQACYTEATDRDNQGRVLTNMAGDVFNDPYGIDIVAIRVTALRNEATFAARTALTFINSVNSLPVSYNGGKWAVDPGQSKVISIQPVSEITSATPYIKVQYDVELRAGYVKDSDGLWDGFKLRVVNQGRRAWVSVGGTPKLGNIVQASASGIENVDRDILLDASGVPFDSNYTVLPLGGGVAGPAVANPNPPTFVVEAPTGAKVVFLKFWPQSVQLKDHGLLQL